MATNIIAPMADLYWKKRDKAKTHETRLWVVHCDEKRTIRNDVPDVF
jgi:hypothetical protein